MTSQAPCPSLPPSPPEPAPGVKDGRPCDYYGAAGTPCVAAHSTTRALYSAYAGPLYSVTRASDMKSKTITTLVAGGFADAASQDAFCKATDCTVEIIFDQSPKGNDLKVSKNIKKKKKKKNRENKENKTQTLFILLLRLLRRRLRRWRRLLSTSVLALAMVNLCSRGRPNTDGGALPTVFPGGAIRYVPTRDGTRTALSSFLC